MELKVWMETGFANGDRHDVIEIDDADIKGLSEEEKEALFDECARDWAMNYLSWGWEP